MSFRILDLLKAIFHVCNCQTTMNNKTNFVKAWQQRVITTLSLSDGSMLLLPRCFSQSHSKWYNAPKKGKDGIKTYACSKCLSGILWVEQTDWRVKGWGARTTQKSSDPRNCLWQSGTHFTNCSNLSNYSLVTRYFESRGKKNHSKTNMTHLHHCWHHFL